MATATGGQLGASLGASSSFGQFRLTTFVDGHPKHPNTTNLRPAIEIVEQTSAPTDSRPELQALLSQPEPSAKTVITSALKSSMSVPPPAPPTELTTHSHNGFGVLDLAPPVVKEGKLGPHRDGRVRNPVPRKLKGKTDDKNGNFAVMHMDMTGSGSDKVPRSEAAKRTSENTAQAARTAQRDGYVPLKRRRVEAAIESPERVAPTNLVANSAPVPPVVLQQETFRRTEILTSEETKYEQARLLTLLRSINPLTVVDQICKALAFFGGIPGAPPPKEGGFPQSEEANGGGGLFVGWLAEIFPELERKERRPEAPKQHLEIHTRRPRGRPRGSKATKVRKDKGIKKGPKYAGNGDAAGPSRLRAATSQEPSSDPAEDEWVDIGDSSQLLVDPGGRPSLVEASIGLKNTVSQDTGHQNLLVISGSNDSSMIDASPIIPTQGYNQLSQQPTVNVGKRRPGRPRGSRNKPKEIDVSDENHHNTFTTIDSQSSSQFYADPLFSPQSRQPVGQQAGLKNPPKAPEVPGRPSSLNDSATGSRTSASSLATKTHAAKIPKDSDQTSNVPAQLTDLSLEEQAILGALRTARAAQVANPAPPAKRKRSQHKGAIALTNDLAATGPVGKISGNQQSLLNTHSTPSQSQAILIDPSSSAIFPVGTTESGSPLLMATNDNPIPVILQSGNQAESSAVVPPPKRQRKPKAPDAPSAKRKSTQEVGKPASTSTTTPVTKSTAAHSSTFSSSKNISEPVVPASRPQAQGLEAHYEHFAQLQQQKQQENHRPRLDQNSLARSASLQSSTNFYQQTQQTPSPFGQQYPSHQASRSYHTTHSTQGDSYRAVNNQPQHASFSPRQQTSSFSHFPDSTFIDLPALESVANGTTNVNAYGTAQGLVRSASQGNYNTATVMGNGFEAGMSDNDLRERLLRGIGRR